MLTPCLLFFAITGGCSPGSTHDTSEFNGVIIEHWSGLRDNGEPYQTMERVYGCMGVLERLHVVDAGGSEAVQSLYYEYDTRGSLSRVDNDDTHDVPTQAFRSYNNLYDESGLLRLQEIDSYADGVIDQRYIFEYGDDANQTVRIDDLDGDGDSDARWYFQWDGSRLVRETLDGREDGTQVQIVPYSVDYFYAGEHIAELEWDWLVDGTVNTQTAMQYQGENLLRVAWDGLSVVDPTTGEPDGEFDAIVYYDYDQHGRIVNIASDWDADGDIEDQSSFQYECGNAPCCTWRPCRNWSEIRKTTQIGCLLGGGVP